MAGFSAVFRGFVPLAAALLLSGCNQQASPQISAGSADSAQIAPSGYSPRPATLAVTSVQGAPSPLQNQFMAYFNADAAKQRRGADRFRRRALSRQGLSLGLSGRWRRAADLCLGHLRPRQSSRAKAGRRDRASRGAADDPWRLVGSQALAALAARSAGDLAAFLSNTPEALAAAPKPAPAAAQPACQRPPPSRRRQALSYAPDR